MATRTKRTRCWAGVLGILLVGGAPVSAGATPSAKDLLARMLQAEGQVSLRGVEETTFAFGPRDKPHIVRERVYLEPVRRKRVEVVAPPERKGHVTVADGKVRRTYFPKRKTVIETPLPDEQRVNRLKRLRFRLLQTNFAIRVTGTETVGGREAYVLEFRPRRYKGGPHRLWLDTRTYVQLKSERRTADGRVVYVREFTRVSFTANDDPGLFTLALPPEVKVQRVHDQTAPLLKPEALEKKAPFRVVAPCRLPGGLVFESARLQTHRGRQVAWIRYIDGLNFISLFESPPRRPDERHAARPKVVKHGALMWTANGLTFVLVGSLPPFQLRALSRALLHPPDPSR